jgi:outer membrane protein TolC
MLRCVSLAFLLELGCPITGVCGAGGDLSPLPPPRSGEGVSVGAVVVGIGEGSVEGVAGSGPLTLHESVAAALRASPQIERARRERNAARVVAEGERPRSGAGLSVGAAGSFTLQGPRITFPKRLEEVTVVPRDRLKLELRAEQTLFQAGQGLAERRAVATESAADLQLRRAEDDLARDVAHAFFGALAARAAEETAARGAAQARAALERVEALLAAGRATPGERLQAEAERAEAERAVRAAAHGVTLADAGLNRLLGRPLLAPLSLVPPAAPPLPVPDQEAAVATALRDRADLEALRQQARAAEAGVGLARLAGRPVVKAGGGYALQTPSAFIARSAWDASVAVTLPLWDGGRTRLQAAEAGERAAGARSALAELEGAVALQVLQARLGVLDAQDRVETLRRATAAAGELLRATELRLNTGRATALELVTDRAALRRAELEEARARYDLRIAWADLRHAMGTREAV